MVVLEDPTVTASRSGDSGPWIREGDDKISGSSHGAVDNRLDFFPDGYIVTSSAVFAGDFSGNCDS
jgi:hypothetical protein